MVKPSKNKSLLSRGKPNKTIKDSGKENCSRWHFNKRLKERLGLKLSDADYDHIVSSIKNEKPCNLCKLRYLYDQSNRLMVWELTFPDQVPVNVIYDKQRKVIVTLLFQQDGLELNFYYDVFKNKVSLKHDLGFNAPWRVKDNELSIPSETVVFKNDVYEVVSEGTLFEKRFKLIDDTLCEVM